MAFLAMTAAAGYSFNLTNRDVQFPAPFICMLLTAY